MQCTHLKVNGTQCQARALTGKSLCLFHDPDASAVASAGRKRGGLSRTSKLGNDKGAETLPPDVPDLPLSNPAEVLAALAVTFNQARRGEISVPVANVLAIIASTILKAQEGAEVERRLREWEAAKKTRKRGFRA
jgi:hypothetical protein